MPKPCGRMAACLSFHKHSSFALFDITFQTAAKDSRHCVTSVSLLAEQYWMLFKMFVDAFSACLMASKGQYVRGTPLATRLQRLCFECGALRTIFAYAHPSRCLSMMSVRSPEPSSCQMSHHQSAGSDIPRCLSSLHLCCLRACIGDSKSTKCP